MLEYESEEKYLEYVLKVGSQELADGADEKWRN